MDKFNQLKERFNSLTPFKKIAVIALASGILLMILLLILASVSPRKASKKPVVPIPVFNLSPSPGLGPLPPQPRPTSTPQASPPVSSLQGLSVMFPSLKDNFIYYLSDGETTFYKASLDGKTKQQISDVLIAQIKQVIWSPDKSSVILKIENNRYFLGKNNSPFLSQEDDNLTLTIWYYNLADKSFKKLDSKIRSIAYSTSENKIAYLKEDAEGSLNKVYTSDPNGASEQRITTLPEQIQNNIVFLDKENVLTFAAPEGYGRNFIYLTSLTAKSTQKINDDGFTFGANPSPKGDLILAQTVKKDPEVFYKDFLSVINTQSKALTVLDIQSSPALAAWAPDGNTIYAFETGKLWVIDAYDFSKKVLDLPGEFSNLKIDADSVIVSSDNSAILFTSNSKLYSIQIR